MKLRNTVIALGIGAETATGLSLLKVNKDLVVGSTAVVVGAGLMIALKENKDLKELPKGSNQSEDFFFSRALEKMENQEYEATAEDRERTPPNAVYHKLSRLDWR